MAYAWDWKEQIQTCFEPMLNEELCPIPGFEGRYSVTRDGRVWSDARQIGGWDKPGAWLTPHLNGKGYVRVVLSHKGKCKTMFVHRLVAFTYIPNPDGKAEVNHIDGDKQNNRVENLEWTTRAENAAHAARLGLYPTGPSSRPYVPRRPETITRGEASPSAVLNDEKVRTIRRLAGEGVSGAQIAKRLGIGRSTASDVINRQSWKHVGERSLFDLAV